MAAYASHDFHYHSYGNAFSLFQLGCVTVDGFFHISRFNNIENDSADTPWKLNCHDRLVCKIR